MQVRAVWGGPHAGAPVLYVAWGFPPADTWVQLTPHPTHDTQAEQRRPHAIRFNVPKRSLVKLIDLDWLPSGRWQGTLSCEPDEETPVRMSLIMQPRTYQPVPRPRKPKPLPTMDSPMPEIRLP